MSVEKTFLLLTGLGTQIIAGDIPSFKLIETDAL
jgi:hypothetical protein